MWRKESAGGDFRAQKSKQDADAMGLKAESVQASIYLGQALLATNHADQAREELDNAVGRSQKLGLRVDEARAQYWLGNAIARQGKASEAVPHYREAVRILGRHREGRWRRPRAGALRPERPLPRSVEVLPGRRIDSVSGNFAGRLTCYPQEKTPESDLRGFVLRSSLLGYCGQKLEPEAGVADSWSGSASPGFGPTARRRFQAGCTLPQGRRSPYLCPTPPDRCYSNSR